MEKNHGSRDFIKESELWSFGQLLNPEFKSKIVMQNPTGGGTFNAETSS